MNELAEYKLGSESVDYIERVLAQGRTLARMLAEVLAFSDGVVVTQLPAGALQDQLVRFADGGKLPRDPKDARHMEAPDGRSFRVEPVPNTDHFLAEVVRNTLGANPTRVFVLEVALAKPADPWVRKLSPLLIHGDDVHLLVNSKGAEPAKIERAIRRAGSAYPPLVAVITSPPKELEVPGERREVSEEVLRVLADRTELLVIGAYDGEGYLIWKPHTSRSLRQ